MAICEVCEEEFIPDNDEVICEDCEEEFDDEEYDDDNDEEE